MESGVVLPSRPGVTIDLPSGSRMPHSFPLQSPPAGEDGAEGDVLPAGPDTVVAPVLDGDVVSPDPGNFVVLPGFCVVCFPTGENPWGV